MALKLSTAVKNARLDAIETAIGAAPTLEVRSGTVPTNITDADGGSVLASITLPSDWLAAASGGSKGISGTWQDLSADATGTATYFRIKVSGTTHVQGTAGASGGGADMGITVNGSASASITAGQSFTVSSFTITDPN